MWLHNIYQPSTKELTKNIHMSGVPTYPPGTNRPRARSPHDVLKNTQKTTKEIISKNPIIIQKNKKKKKKNKNKKMKEKKSYKR